MNIDEIRDKAFEILKKTQDGEGLAARELFDKLDSDEKLFVLFEFSIETISELANHPLLRF